MVKKVRRKLPRNAIEHMIDYCEGQSEASKKSAAKIFREYLKLMDKYADYFFDKPWPEKFNIKESTNFTDEDLNFLFGGKDSELGARYEAMILKKNFCMDVGFMGAWGLFWTEQAFEWKFLRPILYKPVLEAFEKLKQENKNAKEILDSLKKRFPVDTIHDSFVDLYDQEYPEEVTRKLIEEIFNLIHDVEGLEPCKDFKCDWYRNHKYPNLDISSKRHHA